MDPEVQTKGQKRHRALSCVALVPSGPNYLPNPLPEIASPKAAGGHGQPKTALASKVAPQPYCNNEARKSKTDLHTYELSIFKLIKIQKLRFRYRLVSKAI